MADLFSNLRKVVASLLAWIGVLVGVLSAVSAINHLLDIGLEKFLADAVVFYRQLMDPIYGLLRRIPLPFKLSDVSLDFISLYVVLFSMAFRASIIPLSDKEYFREERMKDAEYWTIHAGKLEEPYEDNLMSASQNPDGTYTKELYQLRASWITIAKAVAFALSLWPIVTLSPARGLHLRKYVFRSDGKDRGPFIEFDRTLVSKKYLRLTKMKLLLTAQIILLPVAVVLFYLLAKFNPLGAP